MRPLCRTIKKECPHILLTLSADAPLLHPSHARGPQPTTPLESSHAHLLIALAHQARFIFSLRLLDTGFARDVSGVLRISRGPAHTHWDSDNETEEAAAENDEGEWLYLVGGGGAAADGNATAGVKIFRRGTEA